MSLHWKKIRMKEVKQFVPLSLLNNDAEWESVTEICFKTLRETGLFELLEKFWALFWGFLGVGFFFPPKENFEKDDTI